MNMAQKNKKRLDILVHDKFSQYSRRQIKSWIMQGKIKVDGAIITKPGTQVAENIVIEMSIEEPKYVGRAGFKLEKALDEFDIDVRDLIVLDAGISTGGFTDCLLKRGVKKVYGIDVGYGQVHEKIRDDERVVLLERTNLRKLENVGELVDLVTLDLSFISVLKVMDAVDQLLKKNTGRLVILIKPQFQVRKDQVGRGGIVKDEAVHQEVIERVTDGIKKYSFELVGVIESPILGAAGNKEFLAYFKRKK